MKLWLLLHLGRPLNLSPPCALAQPEVTTPVLELPEETLWPVLCRYQIQIVTMVLFGLKSLRKDEVECNKTSHVSLCRIYWLGSLKHCSSKRSLVLSSLQSS